MPKIDDFYTDDYPREGCQLIVDVKREGYQVTVLAPEGLEGMLQHGRVLERVFAPSGSMLQSFVDGWRANGKELLQDAYSEALTNQLRAKAQQLAVKAETTQCRYVRELLLAQSSLASLDAARAEDRIKT